jgi:excisionase family DNA binding protein
MSHEPSRLIDVRAASELLGRPPSSLYRYAREGLLPAVRIGRAVAFDREALERFIADGGRGLDDSGR